MATDGYPFCVAKWLPGDIVSSASVGLLEVRFDPGVDMFDQYPLSTTPCLAVFSGSRGRRECIVEAASDTDLDYV